VSSTSTRRLAAVLIADVAGYSRLMEQDEAGTHARLLEIRADVTDPAVRRHGGRIVRTVGDGLLVEFPSATSALAAAIEIQRTMAERNHGLPAKGRIDHRIGINLGDILVEENDIAGNGVNVAARLEAIAPPGGIAISGTVRNQVRQDLGVSFVDAGQQHVKNISRPVRVFTVVLGGPPSLWTRLRARRWPRRAAAVVGAVAIAVASLLAYQRWAPHAKPPQSLVVLPFAYPAEVPNAESLSTSLTSHLTGAVSRVTDLTVIAPAVATQLAGRRGEIRSIGRELKVRYALDGRVERNGSDLRLSAHLIDTDSGGSLWNTQLVVAAADDDAAPLALVGRLAESLRSAIRTAELNRVAAGDESTSAYTLALVATEALQRLTDPKQLPPIRERFERALQLDPQHVPALIGYAHALAYETHQVGPGGPRDQLLAQADKMSLQAVTLQPTNAEAWAARANVLFIRNHLDAAAEAAQHGAQLNPYLITLHSLNGQILLALGRGQQALSAFDRSLELDPTSMAGGTLMHFRCRALMLLERYAEAIQSCERGMAFGPEWPDYMVLTAAYALQGDEQRAARVRTELLRLQPEFSIRWHEAVAGRSARARTVFDQVLYAGLRKAGVPEQ
jgi:class 3 adenylate cyclase/TolB-like protein